MNYLMPPDRFRRVFVPLFDKLGVVAVLMAAAWGLALYGFDVWTMGLLATGGVWLSFSVLRQSKRDWMGEEASIRQSAAVSEFDGSSRQSRRDDESRMVDLTESNQHLRKLFDRSALGLLVFDPNDPEVPMRIVDCNEMACRMHGFSREELIGQSLKKIDATYIERKNVRVFLDGIRERVRVHGEAVHIRKDGTTFPIEFATCVLNIGGRELIFGMDRDISDRKAAEAALRSSEERWQLAVEGSRDGIWDRDLLTGAGYLSPQWFAMLGYEPEELGDNRGVWNSLIHPDDREATLEAFQAHLDGKVPVFQHEYRLRKKDGKWLWVFSRGMALFSEDGVATRIVGVNTDITERKEFERALEKARDEAESANNSKSAFLATMSHEIRTPMNGVIGFTNLLLDTELTEQQQDWLVTIRNSGESLLSIINDILDFSKIESGRMEVDLQPLHVRRMVEEVLDLLWSRARERRVELLHYIEPDVPEWVESDPTRLRQVLVNLVGNAIKFTESGEVEVTVRAGGGGPSSPQIVVDVRDTGVGIPQDRLPRLFKPFSQADSSTTRRFGGTGLGLAICRSLVRMLGGEIGVAESGPKGSVFRFNVDAPAVDAPANAIGTTSRLDNASVLSQLEGRTVLGVDDNAANRRILSATLSQWKVKCHMVDSGAAAMEWLESGGRADVAIVDMVMPGMDGLEFATAVRKGRNVRDMPLILLSSMGREEVVGPGSDEFRFILSKPLRRAPLMDSLLSVFSNSGEESVGARKASPLVTEFDRSLATIRPLRILVAEDNPVNQKLISHSLQRFGYRSDMTGNGIECLEALRQRSYDLVLMDCQMPEMDGYEAATRIRSGEAGDRNKEIRIVALTAAAMLGDREKSIVAGMDDHLTKPLQPAQLKAVLRATSPSSGVSAKQAD